MRRALTSLSGRAEFIIVFVAAFGPGAVLSATDVAHPQARLGETSLRILLVYEIIVGAALVVFLRARGWTAPSVGSRPSLPDPIIGLGLALAALVSISILLSIPAKFFPGVPLAPQGGFFAGKPVANLGTIVAVSIINPIFEGLFVTAYVVTWLTKHGSNLGTAITISTAIRLLYHLSFGIVVATLLVVPMGLIFGSYFAHRRRLWPIVVAHGVLDFVGLSGALWTRRAIA